MTRRAGTHLHGRRQRRILWIGAVVAVALVGYLVFEFGRLQAGYNVVDAAAEQEDYEQRIADLKKEVASLKEKLALFETGHDIDREAYQKVEASLGTLQKKILEQREAIAFYRGILSPADGGRGLRVQDLKVTRDKDERKYHLSLVLVQLMQHDQSVKGNVELSIEGAQDGSAATYTWEQLTPSDEESDWPFSFRYFQTFERELILPDGFQPEKVNVEVNSRTKSVANVEQSFPWQPG